MKRTWDRLSRRHLGDKVVSVTERGIKHMKRYRTHKVSQLIYHSIGQEELVVGKKNVVVTVTSSVPLRNVSILACAKLVVVR